MQCYLCHASIDYLVQREIMYFSSFVLWTLFPILVPTAEQKPAEHNPVTNKHNTMISSFTLHNWACPSNEMHRWIKNEIFICDSAFEINSGFALSHLWLLKSAVPPVKQEPNFFSSFCIHRQMSFGALFFSLSYLVPALCVYVNFSANLPYVPEVWYLTARYCLPHLKTMCQFIHLSSSCWYFCFRSFGP